MALVRNSLRVALMLSTLIGSACSAHQHVPQTVAEQAATVARGAWRRPVEDNTILVSDLSTSCTPTGAVTRFDVPLISSDVTVEFSINENAASTWSVRLADKELLTQSIDSVGGGTLAAGPGVLLGGMPLDERVSPTLSPDSIAAVGLALSTPQYLTPGFQQALDQCVPAQAFSWDCFACKAAQYAIFAAHVAAGAACCVGTVAVACIGCATVVGTVGKAADDLVDGACRKACEDVGCPARSPSDSRDHPICGEPEEPESWREPAS